MNSIGSRLAGVGLGALFVVGLAGAGLAYAQTTEDSTPSTTSPPASAPAAPDDGDRDHDCREKGLRGGGGGGGASSSSGTDAGAL